MKRTILLAACVLFAVAALAGSVAWALQQQGGEGREGGGMDPAMMAKWTEFMTPGPAHEVLNQKIGKWSMVVKAFEPGAAEPTESTATTEAKWILGGRYVEDHTEGSFMGMPFRGMGLTGYDNLKKKYVGMWIDNMGTGLLLAEGDYDAATKTFTYASQGPDVMAGEYVPMRSVEKIISADHWIMQMFRPGPDGEEYMSMEMHYTRQK